MPYSMWLQKTTHFFFDSTTLEQTLKSEERPPQMNITSKEELIDYITTLNKTLENEIQYVFPNLTHSIDKEYKNTRIWSQLEAFVMKIRARKELEKQVLQLRKDIEVLVERIEKLSK